MDPHIYLSDHVSCILILDRTPMLSTIRDARWRRQTSNGSWEQGMRRDDVYCVARSETAQYQGAKRLIHHVLLNDPYAAMPKRLVHVPTPTEATSSLRQNKPTTPSSKP